MKKMPGILCSGNESAPLIKSYHQKPKVQTKKSKAADELNLKANRILRRARSPDSHFSNPQH